MSLAPLTRKLGIKPGMRLLIQSAPSRYLESLAPLPDGTRVATKDDGPFAFVQIFVTASADFETLVPKLLTQAGEDALVWIAYRKLSSKLASGLSRDTIRETMSDLGWRSVAIIAIDEIWSALRFRPLAASLRKPAVRGQSSDLVVL